MPMGRKPPPLAADDDGDGDTMQQGGCTRGRTRSTPPFHDLPVEAGPDLRPRSGEQVLTVLSLNSQPG